MGNQERLRTLLPVLVSLIACGGGLARAIEGEESKTAPDASSEDGPAGSPGSTASSSSSWSSPGTSGAWGTSGDPGTSASSTGGPTLPPIDFTVDVCSPQREHDPPRGLTLGPNIDSFELRGRASADASPYEQVLFSIGLEERCARASDRSVCLADYAAASSSPGWPTTYGGWETRYGVLTRKTDGAMPLAAPNDVVLALAPIENPYDAAFLATADGQSTVVCGINNVARIGDDFLVYTQGHSSGSGTRCSTQWRKVHRVTEDGLITVERLNEQCVSGRRPAGLLKKGPHARGDALGCYFAEVAHLEAASVFAFDRLAQELAVLGAPAELIDAAHASRADEVRHAGMTAKMARRFGAEPATAAIDGLPPRSALAVAIENATEGCVRETYGALLAHRQAAAATDTAIRRLMRDIAEDETRHAGLAWDVAAWLEPQLTVDERVLVDDARRRAVAALRRELEAEPHLDLVARAGVPSAPIALALLDALDQRFLAAA